MTPQEIKDYYRTTYNFRKMTGISSTTLANWLKWGYVPTNAQARIEIISGGVLKADESENEMFTRHQQDYICSVVGDWYLKWKGCIATGEHRLGIAKEELKMMLTGENFE